MAIDILDLSSFSYSPLYILPSFMSGPPFIPHLLFFFFFSEKNKNNSLHTYVCVVVDVAGAGCLV